MTLLAVRNFALAFCTVFGSPAFPGSKPVIFPPSAPIVISPPVVDGRGLLILLSAPDGAAPEVAHAVEALARARPGSQAAMAAVDTLADAIAKGKASLPTLTQSEAAQAVRIIEGLITTLTRSGMATPGLDSLRAVIADHTQRALQ